MTEATDGEVCDFKFGPGMGDIDFVEKERVSCFLERLANQADIRETQFVQRSEDESPDFER